MTRTVRCHVVSRRSQVTFANTNPCDATSPRRLFEGLVAGDRASLARSITLVESTTEQNREEAEVLMQMVLKENKRRTENKLESFRMGLTGPPGAGKSTFIETFGKFLTASGHKVAVLTVDPSSATTGGDCLAVFL